MDEEDVQLVAIISEHQGQTSGGVMGSVLFTYFSHNEARGLPCVCHHVVLLYTKDNLQTPLQNYLVCSECMACNWRLQLNSEFSQNTIVKNGKV